MNKGRHRTEHPLARHRSRIPERTVFEMLVQILGERGSPLKTETVYTGASILRLGLRATESPSSRLA